MYERFFVVTVLEESGPDGPKTDVGSASIEKNKVIAITKFHRLMSFIPWGQFLTHNKQTRGTTLPKHKVVVSNIHRICTETQKHVN